MKKYNKNRHNVIQIFFILSNIFSFTMRNIFWQHFHAVPSRNWNPEQIAQTRHGLATALVCFPWKRYISTAHGPQFCARGVMLAGSQHLPLQPRGPAVPLQHPTTQAVLLVLHALAQIYKPIMKSMRKWH